MSVTAAAAPRTTETSPPKPPTAMSPVLILLVIFSFVALIVKMAMDHEKEKFKIMGGKNSENSLGTSELKQLIREAVSDAVAEANAPLVARLEKLEQRKALPPHTPEPADAE